MTVQESRGVEGRCQKYCHVSMTKLQESATRPSGIGDPNLPCEEELSSRDAPPVNPLHEVLTMITKETLSGLGAQREEDTCADFGRQASHSPKVFGEDGLVLENEEAEDDHDRVLEHDRPDDLCDGRLVPCEHFWRLVFRRFSKYGSSSMSIAKKMSEYAQ